MRLRSLPWIATAVLCALGAPAIAWDPGDWVDIKTSQELRELYSNKTFTSMNWAGHYRADGKGMLTPLGQKPQLRTWEVKGEDQVCATPEGGATSCYKFQRNRKNPKLFLIKSVERSWSDVFTVEDGIPKF